MLIKQCGEEQNSRYTNRDNDPRGDWKAADMTVKSYSSSYDYPITTPSGRVVTPSEGRCWNTSKENFEKLVADNRIWFGENGDNMPAVKKFLTEVKDGVVPLTIWQYEEVGHNQEGRQELKKLFDNKGFFDGPKPVRLINKILKIANIGENDIILDFFSGSATTAHAVMQLNKEDGGNRKFICVQLPEVCEENTEAYKAGYKTICEIGKERIRRAGKKLNAEFGNRNSELDLQMELDDNNSAFSTPHSELDIGFRVLKLDSSNLKTWDTTPVEEEQMSLFVERMNNMVHRVKTDRTDMDMVFEVMLKLGVQPTTVVEKKDVNGKTVYTVGNDSLLLICLAENVKPEDVEAMAEFAPGKIVISRDSFADDTAMANAHYILRDRKIELKLV